MLNFKLKRTKLIDSPSPFYRDLEGALVHNPYLGTFHRGRQYKKDGIDISRNPYIGTHLHSPRAVNGLKSLLAKPPCVPFITQLQLIKEKNLNCAHLCRESLMELTTITYNSDTQLDSVHNICAICLEEFEDGHLLRVLPNCSHTFHKNCVDHWLMGTFSEDETVTSFCPTCRRNASIADSLPESPSPGIDIPMEVFVRIGSLLVSDYFDEDQKEEKVEEEELVPCITLESSEYSTCGFPLNI
jgi:hypothetical protein